MAGAATPPNHTNAPLLLHQQLASPVNRRPWRRRNRERSSSPHLGAEETVNDRRPRDSKISNGGEAPPRRVRAGRGPAAAARRQAHAPPAVLLHGDPGGPAAEAGAQPVQVPRASPPPRGAGGAAGGADAEPAVPREAAFHLAAAGGGACGVEAGVPDPAAAAHLHGQQDRGRGGQPAGGDPRGRAHRLARRAPPGAARRGGPGVRRLPAGRARGLVRRRVPEERRQGARGQAPAADGRREPDHARRPRHGDRPPVHRQLVLGPLPQVPHRRPRGRRRRRTGPGGHDGGLRRQGPPRRALPQALPARPHRRRLEAREDRQGRRVPPEAQEKQRRHRAGVRPHAHGEARRAARDSWRRHDGPHVGRDDQPRQDLRRPRRQGVRARHDAGHHLRGLHLQDREGRDRQRPVAAAAPAEQGPDGNGAADAAGRVRAPPPTPGSRLHAPWPRRRQQQRSTAAECSSTCRAGGAGGHAALVPERRGDGVPHRRRGGSHSPRQQQLRLPVDWPGLPHARLTRMERPSTSKKMNK